MKSQSQGSPWALQDPPTCKYLEPKMQTLTRMETIVIYNYYYMTTMDDNVSWTEVTHLL